MSKLKIMKLQLQYKKIECIKDEIEVKIIERLEYVERLEKQKIEQGDYLENINKQIKELEN